MCVYVCTYVEILRKFPTVMEAGKSHSRPSTSWRSRKASDVIQSKSEDLRPREVDGVNLRPRAGKNEMRCPNSSSEAGEKERIPPSSALCSPQALRDDALPPWRGECTDSNAPLLYTHPHRHTQRSV